MASALSKHDIQLRSWLWPSYGKSLERFLGCKEGYLQEMRNWDALPQERKEEVHSEIKTYWIAIEKCSEHGLLEVDTYYGDIIRRAKNMYREVFDEHLRAQRAVLEADIHGLIRDNFPDAEYVQIQKEIDLFPTANGLVEMIEAGVKGYVTILESQLKGESKRYAAEKNTAKKNGLYHAIIDTAKEYNRFVERTNEEMREKVVDKKCMGVVGELMGLCENI